MCPAFAEEVLITRGAQSTWQYLDAGQAADKEWAALNDDPAHWKSGPAPLGYGRPGMQTTVSFGVNALAKPITTYFRHSVDVAAPGKVETLVLYLRRDDGAVVYWNGVEIVRSNMPSGPIRPDTLAPRVVSGDMETEFHRYVIPVKDLVVVKGRNVRAVEIHQANAGSSDIIFDLEATAYAPGESPKPDIYADALTALRAGDLEKAWPLLLEVDSAHADYARWLMQIALAFVPQKGVPDDGRYWTLIDKARAAAPDDMEIVYAWIRARVDARKNFPIKLERRALPAAIPDEFRFIADTPEHSLGGRILSREQYLADIDDLELILENCYAYLERRNANYRGALDALRASITENTTRDVFSYRVARMLTVFGDPHSRVVEGVVDERRAILHFVMDGDRLAAVKPDRSGFIEEGAPYITEINARPAAEWLAAAEQIVDQASPQYRRHLALEQLLTLPAVARQMKLAGDSYTLTLASPDGKIQKMHRLTLHSSSHARARRWADCSNELMWDVMEVLDVRVWIVSTSTFHFKLL